MNALQQFVTPGSAVVARPGERPAPQGNNGPYAPITIKVASTRAEREAAFRLVYQRYLGAGLCPPNPYQMRVTPYHLLPTTTLFVALYQGEVIFTLSLIGDGELGVPMQSIFPDEMNALRAQGVRFGELSCLADRRRELVRFLPVFVQVTRFMLQYSIRQGRERFVIAVHPKHVRFYERFVGFRPLAGERLYGSVLNKPAVAASSEPAWLTPDRYEQYLGTPIPAADLEPQPWPEEDFEYFRPAVVPLGTSELISGGYEMSGKEGETNHDTPPPRAGLGGASETVHD